MCVVPLDLLFNVRFFITEALNTNHVFKEIMYIYDNPTSFSYLIFCQSFLNFNLVSSRKIINKGVQ
jgi:hypothetical protein